MVDLTFVKVRMDGSRGEVQEMIDDEDANNRPAPSHSAGCKVRPNRPPSFISNGPALLADPGQLKSRDDVQAHCEKKYCTRGPQQTRVQFEKGGVRVNSRGPSEYQQVPRNMADEVAHADRAGSGHHDLFPYCGVPEGDQAWSLDGAWKEFFAGLPHYKRSYGSEKFGPGNRADDFFKSQSLQGLTIAARPKIDYIRLSCRFRKRSLKPDLCTLKSLRNNAVILGQFSLLKKLFLVDSGDLGFRVEVNLGDP